jgi:hypothetical protein
MTADEPPQDPPTPASFLAAKAALETIQGAVHTAQSSPPTAGGEGERTRSEQALAALLLLREMREQLAGWETGLIETARDAGASWAELAGPLGVASRQAAERRYLRLRPGDPGSTGEQRVQAVRDRRAADRSVTAWARDNAADLRQLAGQIIGVPGLPTTARNPLVQALGHDDAGTLLAPLAAVHEHLADKRPDLADRIDTLHHHTDRLRQGSSHRRP